MTKPSKANLERAVALCTYRNEETHDVYHECPQCVRSARALDEAVAEEREAIVGVIERYQTGSVIVADALVKHIRARGTK